MSPMLGGLRLRLVPTLALLLAFAASGCRAPWGSRGDALVLAGSFEANDVRVGSLVGGRVDSVFAHEGDSVRVGDRLLSLDPSLIDAQIAEQRGLVAAARAKYDLVRRGPRKEEIAKAKVEYENAESERKRFEALLKDGMVAPQQYESAEALAASRRETYQALVNGSRPEDIASARASLDGAEGRLRYLLQEREESVIVAPIRGFVQTLDLRPGDLVAARQPVAVLLEEGPLTVRVYVPEPRLGLVRVGQAVDLRVDTYPKRVFPGRVVEISSRAEYMPRNVQTLEQRNDQVFGVKIETDPAPELKSGMAATATIRTAEPAR
ncbi:MAG TPA: HlyD family efflux transporter periplasmic adaptor subunit [Candidatus Eisenbacteria bacterium]|nr:HlyD family efflux transporter periplasmic adaptor subunit [Candidatus Eisenbacteria bacterium]